MEDHSGTTGSEEDDENIPVAQYPTIVASMSDENCRPHLSQSLLQQSLSHKGVKEFTVYK